MRLISKKDEHWLTHEDVHLRAIARKWECCQYEFVRYQPPHGQERLEVYYNTTTHPNCVFQFNPDHFYCCPCCGKGIPDIRFEALLGAEVND